MGYKKDFVKHLVESNVLNSNVELYDYVYDGVFLESENSDVSEYFANGVDAADVKKLCELIRARDEDIAAEYGKNNALPADDEITAIINKYK